MGFNVSNFVNTASKSISNRVVSDGFNTVTSVLGVGPLANALLQVGSAASTISSVASLKLDSVISQVSSDFFDSVVLGKTTKEGSSRIVKGIEHLIGINPKSKTAAKNTTQLSYPSDLGDYFVSFELYDYTRPAPMVVGKKTNNKFINLPLPLQLRDEQEIGYETPSLGIAGTFADLVQINTEQGGAKQEGQGAALAAATTGRLIKMAAIGAVLPTVVAAGSQLAGTAINPNMSAVFTGPQLRRFSMEWTFSPNNPQESKTLKDIIFELRKRALPGMTYKDSVGLLSYPQTCMVKFHPNNLIMHKNSVITSINVDYTVAGIPSFFVGTKLPTFIRLGLSFLEIEYFLSEDYGGAELYSKDGTGRGVSSDLGAITTNVAKQVSSATGFDITPILNKLGG